MSQQALLSPRNHLLFWTSFLVFLGLFVWAFGDVLLPFVLGAATAYLLDPLVEFMAKRRISRTVATLTILGIFVVAVATLFVCVTPILYREVLQLADLVPGYIEKLWAMLTPYNGWLQEHLGEQDVNAVRDALKNNVGKALKVGGGILGGLVSGGQALMSFITVAILTPIVAFFMMKEWPKMTSWIDQQLPRGSHKDIKGLLGQINGKISGFIRGQLTVACALSLTYALALTLAGLNFGFLIGMAAGLLSIIPLVGSTLGLIISILVAWFQSGELSYVGIIAAIFVTGQFVEGNILTPRLLGKSVGMHPLWIIFALMAGGSLFGIVGMLIAVPLAASAGVLISYGLARYRESSYYKDSKTTAKKSAKKASKKTKK